MPRPLNVRQSLEQERAELLGQLAAYQRELDATPPENKAWGDAGMADPAGSEAADGD